MENVREETENMQYYHFRPVSWPTFGSAFWANLGCFRQLSAIIRPWVIPVRWIHTPMYQLIKLADFLQFFFSSTSDKTYARGFRAPHFTQVNMQEKCWGKNCILGDLWWYIRHLCPKQASRELLRGTTKTVFFALRICGSHILLVCINKTSPS